MLHWAKGPPHNSFECFDERRTAGKGRRVSRENPSGFIRPVSLHRVFEVCMFLRGGFLATTMVALGLGV